jgi:DNA-directed RNA polymerase subunit RPC12/RpoP
MRWTPRTIRIGVVLALASPLAVILLANSLAAQYQPPKMPQSKPPQVPQPQIAVWKCLTCGKIIGSGASPPPTCPYCGVRIVNSTVAPPNPNPVPGTPPPEIQKILDMHKKTAADPASPVPNPPPGSKPKVEKESGPQSDNTTLWVVLGIVGTVLVLGVAGLVGFLTLGRTKPKRSAKRRRRRSTRSHEEDDD